MAAWVAMSDEACKDGICPLPSFGKSADMAVYSPVPASSVKIRLPAKWDALMFERGYEPLAKFKLACDLAPDAPRRRVRGYSRPGVRGDRR